MLATYISIRPKELITIKEKDIDLENGYIFIPHPKEKKQKVSHLDNNLAIGVFINGRKKHAIIWGFMGYTYMEGPDTAQHLP